MAKEANLENGKFHSKPKNYYKALGFLSFRKEQLKHNFKIWETDMAMKSLSWKKPIRVELVPKMSMLDCQKFFHTLLGWSHTLWSAKQAQISNIVHYLLQPSLELNCGKFHFCSFVYKSLKPTVSSLLSFLVPFSFKFFVLV